MKPRFYRIYIIMLLSINLIALATLPIASANAQDLPHKPASHAVAEHVLLVITANVIDVTDTLFVQNENIYAIINNMYVLIIIDYFNNKIWSENGTQIGFITVN